MAIDVAGGAAKMRSRMDAASWLRGIQQMTVAPNQKAADAKEKYRTGTALAVTSGRYAAGNRRVTKEAFVAAATAKQTHYAEAGDTAAQHWESVMNAGLAAAVDGVATSVRSMPNDTQAQRKARMNANFDKMSMLRGKFKYSQAA